MGWFNWIGLLFVVVLLIPNLIYGIKTRGNPPLLYHNRALESLEQIGRFGCMAAMVFHLPYVCLGFPSDLWLVLYASVGSALLLAYALFWIIFAKRDSVAKAILLSALPSALFLVAGTLSVNFLLLGFALLFAPTHILISLRSAFLRKENERR